MLPLELVLVHLATGELSRVGDFGTGGCLNATKLFFLGGYGGFLPRTLTLMGLMLLILLMEAFVVLVMLVGLLLRLLGLRLVFGLVLLGLGLVLLMLLGCWG